MRSRNVALRHRNRHYVLQLITEAISPARLIKGCASPYPAGKCLIEQPAIHQNIQRSVRGGDLYGAEHVVPLPVDLEQDLVEVGGAIAADQLLRLFPVFPLT